MYCRVDGNKVQMNVIIKTELMCNWCAQMHTAMSNYCRENDPFLSSAAVSVSGVRVSLSI